MLIEFNDNEPDAVQRVADAIRATGRTYVVIVSRRDAKHTDAVVSASPEEGAFPVVGAASFLIAYARHTSEDPARSGLYRTLASKFADEVEEAYERLNDGLDTAHARPADVPQDVKASVVQPPAVPSTKDEVAYSNMSDSILSQGTGVIQSYDLSEDEQDAVIFARVFEMLADSTPEETEENNRKTERIDEMLREAGFNLYDTGQYAMRAMCDEIVQYRLDNPDTEEEST
jgi:hypothetical protein